MMSLAASMSGEAGALLHSSRVLTSSAPSLPHPLTPSLPHLLASLPLTFSFLLSLASCPSCVVIDDHLNILPISSHTLTLTPSPHRTEVGISPVAYFNTPPPSLSLPPWQEEASSASQKELRSLQESMADTQPVGPMLSSCLSVDQVCQYAVVTCDYFSACDRQRLCWCLWRHSRNRHRDLLLL